MIKPLKPNKSTSGMPLITIIVAVLNRATTLNRCLNSIIEQIYPYKELIVIDGGSTDDSVSIINDFKNSIEYWESSPDRGIYHAWNKALRHSHGDWICFLGADDYFCNKNVLINLLPFLIQANKHNIRVVYGRIAKVDSSGNVTKYVGKPWNKIKWLMPHGMPLPHPGLMHQCRIFKERGFFDERYKISGDYDLLLRELINSNALYANGVLTVYCKNGGIADSNNFLSHREVATARKNNGLPAFSIIWALIFYRNLLRRFWRLIKNGINYKKYL